MGQNLLPLSGAIMDPDRPLPKRLRDKLERVIEGPLGGDDYCPCVWLNRFTGKCIHYKHRPTMCRDVLQLGDETCLGIRSDFFGETDKRDP